MDMLRVNSYPQHFSCGCLCSSCDCLVLFGPSECFVARLWLAKITHFWVSDDILTNSARFVGPQKLALGERQAADYFLVTMGSRELGEREANWDGESDRWLKGNLSEPGERNLGRTLPKRHERSLPGWSEIRGGPANRPKSCIEKSPFHSSCKRIGERLPADARGCTSNYWDCSVMYGWLWNGRQKHRLQRNWKTVGFYFIRW